MSKDIGPDDREYFWTKIQLGRDGVAKEYEAKRDRSCSFGWQGYLVRMSSTEEGEGPTHYEIRWRVDGPMVTLRIEQASPPNNVSQRTRNDHVSLTLPVSVFREWFGHLCEEGEDGEA